jgi:hypothetical protein
MFNSGDFEGMGKALLVFGIVIAAVLCGIGYALGRLAH